MTMRHMKRMLCNLLKYFSLHITFFIIRSNRVRLFLLFFIFSFGWLTKPSLIALIYMHSNWITNLSFPETNTIVLCVLRMFMEYICTMQCIQIANVFSTFITLNQNKNIHKMTIVKFFFWINFKTIYKI